MSNITIQVRREGDLTLPEEIRSKYQIREGDLLNLIDLGDGSFILTPLTSKVDQLGSLFAEEMSKAGVSLDDLLEALDEEREQYYQQHYVQR
jgi:bifunctional DNA-binding transcriptional regulator/antitoxin component of YhaV-PrlF toxin-antitoxin module